MGAVMHPSPEDGSGITLLDLTDNLMGAIYTKLLPQRENGRQDNLDRASLRQSCTAFYRCKSINSSIRSLEIRAPSDFEAPVNLSEAVQMLNAFPPHAELAALVIEGNPMTKRSHMQLACLHDMLKSETARARLATVTRLELKFSRLEGDCAALLPFLLPALKEVSFFFCESDANFLRILGPKIQLHKLSLSATNFQGMPERVLPVAQLSELWHLRELHLGYGVELPAGVKLVSNTLQSLSISTLTFPMCSALSSSGLPALSCLEIRAFDTNDAADMDMKDTVSKLEVISSFGLKAADGNLQLLGRKGWSDHQSLSILKAFSIAPVAGFCSTVRDLCLEDWNICPGFMNVLAKVFFDARSVILGDEYDCLYKDYESGLFDAVTGMHALGGLNLSFNSSDDVIAMPSDYVNDCLKALLAVQKNGRSFHLFVRLYKRPELWQAARALEDQFQILLMRQASKTVGLSLQLTDIDCMSDWESFLKRMHNRY